MEKDKDEFKVEINNNVFPTVSVTYKGVMLSEDFMSNIFRKTRIKWTVRSMKKTLKNIVDEP